MSRNDDDRFRVRPGTPKQRGDRFITQVLRQASKAGTKAAAKAGRQPGARLGRGHVAARFAGAKLAPNARRVAIEARLVNLAKAALAALTGQPPMPPTSTPSRSAARTTATSSVSSSRPKTPSNWTTCAPTPAT